jgi:osmoprotectant transport system ATP-binding protein
MINRLEVPTSGEILFGGVDISTRPAHELRRDMGYVIQGIGLFPHRTVAQNIATVPKLLGWDQARIRARVDELVELVDLDPSLLDRYPARLSGGQQQRVGVARALAADPPVLLMDEPYSAVDPIVRAHLQDELIALHERLGTTIVLVTHDIDEALKVGDRIAVMAVGGRLAQYATPADLLAQPADDFVRGFVGERRSLRRLALVQLSEVSLDPVDLAAPPTGPSLEETATASDALDLLIATGAHSVAVTRNGVPLGLVTFETLSWSVHEDGAPDVGADLDLDPAG